MENIEIEGYSGDYFIPSVSFNATTGVCELAGESFLEETLKFYEPLLKWLDEFCKTAKKPITFNFKLSYFNTSSSKRILDILLIMKDYEDHGGKVTVNWIFDEEDIDIEEDVEDLMIISELKVNIIKSYEK